MGRGKKYQPEQAVNLPHQIEVRVANSKTAAQASKEAEIVEQTDLSILSSRRPGWFSSTAEAWDGQRISATESRA